MTTTDVLIAATSGPTERLAYSPSEAAEALGVSKPTVYKLLHNGQLRSIMVGNRRLIPRTGIEAFLEGDREKS
jgi:excisionase family DNA binding protein